MHVHVLGVPHLLQGRLQVFVARGDLDEPAASWCHLVQNSDHGAVQTEPSFSDDKTGGRYARPHRAVHICKVTILWRRSSDA